MKRRTAILAAAGVSLALVGGSSAVAFGTDLFGARAAGGPGALPPVVNTQSTAGTSGSAQPQRDERAAEGGHPESGQTPPGALPGHSEDD